MGKGSAPRPIPNPDKFRDNWDAIFKKPKHIVSQLEDGWYVLEPGGVCAIKVAGPFKTEKEAKEKK